MSVENSDSVNNQADPWQSANDSCAISGGTSARNRFDDDFVNSSRLPDSDDYIKSLGVYANRFVKCY